MGNQTYWYWIENVDITGENSLSEPISLTIPQGEGDNDEVKRAVYLRNGCAATCFSRSYEW